MTNFQRRRGTVAKVFRSVETTDNRGHKVSIVEPNNPHEVKVWVFPQRQSRAEVPGQLGIEVIKIGIPFGLEGVDLWSRVEIFGKSWDVISPPEVHIGTRHVRHWVVDLRGRPSA